MHAIQKMLGHQKLVTTLAYFHLTDLGTQDVREITERLMSAPGNNSNNQEADNGKDS